MSLCLTMQQEKEIDSIFHRWQKGLCPPEGRSDLR